MEIFKLTADYCSPRLQANKEIKGKIIDVIKTQIYSRTIIREIKSQERILITETTNKYSLMRDIFTRLLDMKENNYEIMAKGLDTLTEVVKTSPFADILSLKERIALNGPPEEL
jgi:hypothetical protein